MQFRILGPLEVTDGDRLIDVGGPRQRALLAMLLVDANRVVSADRLIEGLWGEQATSRAAAGLQVLVSNLRRALEPDRPARTPPRVLVTKPPGYLLVVEPSALDAARFESLLTEGQRQVREGRPEEAQVVLEQALSLWRGPALAEFAYDDFARSEAARLQELLTVALEEQAEADLQLGRHGAAVARLEHLVGEHPLRERLWALLMIAYYRSGRQADALRAFQQARGRLADELGIDPSPALQQLESDLLAQAPSLEWHPPASPMPAGGARPPPPDRVAGPPLVGRADELRRLLAALDQVAGATSRVVLVSGDPGVGKTRLVEELAAIAEGRGAVVAWGRCHEGDGAPPFWPWIQVVRTVAAAALGQAPAAVTQLLPELAEAPAVDHQPHADPLHARFQLCQDLTVYLCGQAASQCIVVVLEDLHWADPPSMELLSILVSRLGRARLLVVGTYRAIDVDADHPLSATMATLARQRVVERLSLTGIGPEDSGPFIAAAIGAEPTAELAAAVHARTDGNPFFMTELLRLLESERSVSGVDHEAVLHAPVPVGVREVISRRFAQLTPTARTTLTVAAVVGREFDQALVDATCDVGEEEALAGIELALSRGILVESPDRVGRYRFCHALVRETIYAGISGLRRARLHARVGEALERGLGARGERQVAELAYHFGNALPVAGAAKALGYVVADADAAAAQLAYERAEAQLRRGLAMVESLPEPEQATAELRVLSRLGTLLAATRGQSAPEVEVAFSRASELCRQIDAGRDAVTALWGFFYSSYVRGRLDDAVAIAGDLLVLAAERSIPEMALAGQLAMGITSFHRGELAAARDHLGASVEIADGLGDRSLAAVFQVDPRVYSRCFRALVLALGGEPDAGGVIAQQARELASEVPQPFSMATAAMFSAWLGFLLDDPGLAGDHAAATIELSVEHGFPLLAAAGIVFDGWAMARTQRVEEGAARVATGLAAFRGAGTTGQPLFVALEAEVEHLAGRSESALALLDKVLAGTGESDEHHYFEAALHRLRAEILMAAFPERSVEAAEALRRSVAVAAAQGAVLLEQRASGGMA